MEMMKLILKMWVDNKTDHTSIYNFAYLIARFTYKS